MWPHSGKYCATVSFSESLPSSTSFMTATADTGCMCLWCVLFDVVVLRIMYVLVCVFTLGL